VRMHSHVGVRVTRGWLYKKEADRRSAGLILLEVSTGSRAKTQIHGESESLTSIRIQAPQRRCRKSRL
jgi:hypothetical protein